MAEREGFEPSVRVSARLITNQVHSTTLPPLRIAKKSVPTPVWQWPAAQGRDSIPPKRHYSSTGHGFSVPELRTPTRTDSIVPGPIGTPLQPPLPAPHFHP